MLTTIERTQRFLSFPRSAAEARVFTASEVTEHGMRVFLKVDQDGALTLPTAAAVAILEELVVSARRRLLELELAALPQEVLRGADRAAGAAVGAAGEAGERPRDPG